MCMETHEKRLFQRPEASNSLELKLQGMLTFLTYLLEFELESSTTVVYIHSSLLNHLAIPNFLMFLYSNSKSPLTMAIPIF